MAPIPRLRSYEGPALLSYGFRPFFLLGSLYAGLAILVWLPMFYGELSLALDTWRVLAWTGEPQALERQRLDWVDPGVLDPARLAPADREILRRLLAQG